MDTYADDLTALVATLKVYAGAPHGLTATRKDEVNRGLLAFLRTSSSKDATHI